MQAFVNHADCAIATEELQPVIVDRVFYIVGIDIMELPAKVISMLHMVIQDFLSKWPFVFATMQGSESYMQYYTIKIVSGGESANHT